MELDSEPLYFRRPMGIVPMAANLYISWLLRLAQRFLPEVASVIAVSLWFLVRQFPQRLHAILGRSWATAQGKVETASVKTFQNNCLGEIGYSYCVNDEFFSGYYSRQFLDEQSAWDYVDGLKEQVIVVRYKAKRPEVSAFRPEDQSATIRAQDASRSVLSDFLLLLTGRQSRL